jgi:hypothetical protein
MTAATPHAHPPARLIWLRIALLLAAIVLLNVGGSWLVAQFDFSIRPSNSDMIYRLVLLATLVYVLAMAMPFVPGIEIGLAIMLAMGPAGVPFVYVCTLIALALAFLIGRFIPLTLMARLFAWLHLKKASHMVAMLAAQPPAERLGLLLDEAPAGWAHRLLVHRHLTVAVVLNLPGNAVIGGAGGIAMIAGMSRLFRFPLFMLTMAIAITPVPIILLLTR